MSIVEKIKKAKLTGRGGASYPTATKWEAVKKAKGINKYVVCNCSEGEPDIDKDKFLLEHHLDDVINGMKIAINYLGAFKGYFYINPEYHLEFKGKLKKAIKKSGAKIDVFCKPHEAGYIGGEETSVLNTIEGKRTEPRLRPPFPVTQGLWKQPTLINNVETFYYVSLIDKGLYENKKFYHITGDCLWDGVYEVDEKWSVEEILKRTKNYPDYDFFVQIGGGASGEVLDKTQLKKKVATGSGSIKIYSVLKYKPIELIRKWLIFFSHESCGQCTPCREGTYRLLETINQEKPDWNLFNDLINTLSETAFCGLGYSVSVPLKSFMINVYGKYYKK